MFGYHKVTDVVEELQNRLRHDSARVLQIPLGFLKRSDLMWLNVKIRLNHWLRIWPLDPLLISFEVFQFSLELVNALMW